MNELFAFEVATSAGRFRIIGPDTLPHDEAVRIGQKIAALLPLLVLEPDLTEPRLVNEFGRVDCAACGVSVLPENWANHVVGKRHEQRTAPR